MISNATYTIGLGDREREREMERFRKGNGEKDIYGSYPGGVCNILS